MAIYYIDPHTTTNGTGTWASPWSINSSTRTGLTNSDEIRIKGVALTSLLTATTYTVTYATATTVTVTAGGGLGADFAAGNIVYFPANGAFARVASVSTNTLTIGGSSAGGVPWYNTSAGQTTISLRKVDTTTYGVSTTGATGYIYNTMLSGLTISDCWVDVAGTPTRYTDGTVKTLITTSSTSGVTFNIGNGTATSAITASTVTLPNTSFLNGPSSSAGCTVYTGSTKSTYTIGQIFSVGFASGLAIGAASEPFCEDMTITITHFSSYDLFYSAIDCYNLTLTIENYIVNYAFNWFGAATSGIRRIGGTFNLTIKNVVFTQTSAATATPYFQQIGAQVNLTMDGKLDYYGSTTISQLINQSNRLSVTFTSNFGIYVNRRVTTISSVTYKVIGSGYLQNYMYDSSYLPDLPTLPTGWTSTYDLGTIYPLSASSNSGQTAGAIVFPRQPRQYKISLQNSTATKSSLYFQQTANGVNTLFTYRDGSSPIEILTFAALPATTAYSYNLPIVSTDAAVYRTAGPSLKSYLQTYSSSIVISANSRAQKLIRIPITSGTSYTVAGYIRTDIATVANGDCVMYVYFNDTSLGSQSMTTASYNAWESFSIAFTATYTGEAVLVWDMYYAAAGSFWLDDLTVT